MSHPIQQISRSKNELNSPVPSSKSTFTSQSSLLDSPIAQLLGFGSSSSQNINFPSIPPINSNSNKNLNGNISNSNSTSFFNSQPTFSETKDANDNKLDENKNFSNRLHHFQPPPLLLPNQKILQPDFIESPRTNDQDDDFVGDFEYYPGESASFNFRLNNLDNNIKNSDSFIYSNVNTSPSPKTSTFDRSYAAVDIANNVNENNSNEKEKAIDHLNSSSSFAKNGINRSSNKNLINLNLVTSPKLKPYMSSPFAVQNSSSGPISTFVNGNNDNKMDSSSIIFNGISTPSPKASSFAFDDDSGSDVATHKFDHIQSTPKSNLLNSHFTNSISDSKSSNASTLSGLRPLFTNASKTMLKLENDISVLKNTLADVHDKYVRKYNSEKEKYRNEIISMIERHREEFKNACDIIDDNSNYNQPIIQSSPKRSSRTRNKNRNSNRRIRHDDLYEDSSDKKQVSNYLKQSQIDIDQIILGHNSNKFLNLIGSSPPLTLHKDDIAIPSPLKVSRVSGQPIINSHPENVLHVRVKIPNKKDLFINNPKIKTLLNRQREEIISLNEESSSKLASISEEAASAEKQITDRIAELSASKNNKSNTNFFVNSDASSSSSSAPNVFYVDDSDGSAKDEFGMLSTISPMNSPALPSKYSSSSSSLSSSSISSSNSKMKQEQEQKSSNQSLISVSGKPRNGPQRLLRHIPR